MNKEEIQSLAKESANQNEPEPISPEWDAHYYGFIYGFQAAEKLAKKRELGAKIAELVDATASIPERYMPNAYSRIKELKQQLKELEG